MKKNKIVFSKKIMDGVNAFWMLHDGETPHREDGPAIKYESGGVEWWFNGEPHREDGPAIHRADGSKEYYLNYRCYTEDEYKKEMKLRKKKKLTLKQNYAGYNLKRWEIFPRMYHNQNGPAIDNDNEEKWYLFGLLHREDGPALTDKYSRQWYMHGKLHREDGPAYESRVDDFKEWRLNGYEYSEEGFHIEIKRRRRSKILNDILDIQV
ncbi:hypothetical protein [Psychroflexus montanilacus]|uniref:hypothetical protein n=1 Tax=Psychroflexus montanilacus TaxID=2873598 RepID=UPI001CCB6146|nr:hypothetical protein [Psychroflexus montanilacus]MBZ9652652.1 hypothetical protein [Psychroflexus montanilacus]